MGCYAKDVIAYARTWNSYQEKKSMGTRAQLEQKHWNPGSANITIFWEWFKDWGYDKWYFQGGAWCANFVSCCFTKAFGLEKAKQLLGGDLYINCQDFVNKRSKDKRMNYSPAVGDVVCFWNGKKWSHTGMVTGVYKSYITSIEGNTSGEHDKVIPDGGAVVEKRHYFDTTKMIYRHPDYDKEETAKVTVSDPIQIGTGREGVTISAALNYRDKPYDGKILGTFKQGEHAYPSQKCFVATQSRSTPWFYDPAHGWFSANYAASGWVYEASVGRWWWIKSPGYKYDVNKLFEVDGHYYYADNTGYIVQSQWVELENGWMYFDQDGAAVKNCYVKSATGPTYYWVGPSYRWDTGYDTYDVDKTRFRVIE